MNALGGGVTSMPEALAIIPARGGSKGIPRKNLQEVGGIPLVQRTIEAAQQSQFIKRVTVSTDDKEIATLSKACGAIVIERPIDLSTDEASSESALLHSISSLSLDGSLEAVVVFLQCTSPFTTGADIDQVVKALESEETNSAFAATPWHGFLWTSNGLGINHNPHEPRKRRQELETCYLETGSIYAIKTREFLLHKTRFCHPTKPIVVRHNPIEIDTQSDLAISRAISNTSTKNT